MLTPIRRACGSQAGSAAGGELRERHTLLEVEQVELQLVRGVAGGQRADHGEQQVRLARPARAADQRVRGGVGEHQLAGDRPRRSRPARRAPVRESCGLPPLLRQAAAREGARPGCATARARRAIAWQASDHGRAGQRRVGHHGDVRAGHRGRRRRSLARAVGSPSCSRTVSSGAPMVIGTSTSTTEIPQARPPRSTRWSWLRPPRQRRAVADEHRHDPRLGPRSPVAAPAPASDGWPSTRTRVCTRRIRSASSSSSPSRSPGSWTVSRPVRVSG